MTSAGRDLASTAILVTDQGLRTAHLVRDFVVSGGGRVQALCGRVFVPASLVEPLGTPCALCVAVLRPPQPPGRRWWFRRR